MKQCQPTERHPRFPIITSDGTTIEVTGDPNMSEEAKAAIAQRVEAVMVDSGLNDFIRDCREDGLLVTVIFEPKPERGLQG